MRIRSPYETTVLQRLSEPSIRHVRRFLGGTHCQRFRRFIGNVLHANKCTEDGWRGRRSFLATVYLALPMHHPPPRGREAMVFDVWHAGEQRGLEKRERVAAGLAKARRGARGETRRSRGMGRSTLCLRTGYRARVLINSEAIDETRTTLALSRRVVKDHLLPTLSRFAPRVFPRGREREEDQTSRNFISRKRKTRGLFNGSSKPLGL